MQLLFQMEKKTRYQSREIVLCPWKYHIKQVQIFIDTLNSKKIIRRAVIMFQAYFNMFWNVKEEFIGWWQSMNWEECGTSQGILMISTSPISSSDTSSKTTNFCQYFRHYCIFLRLDFLRLWSLDGVNNHWRDFSHIII